MANTMLIEQLIRDRGYKLQFVAKSLSISPNTLHKKLLGETQFKVDEAEKLSAMLGMTMVERDACFFEQQNWLELRVMQPVMERRNVHDERTACPDKTGAAAVWNEKMGTKPCQ